MNARFYLLIFVPRFIIDTAAPSFYLLTRKGDAESCEGVPGRLNLFFKRVDNEKNPNIKRIGAKIWKPENVPGSSPECIFVA